MDLNVVMIKALQLVLSLSILVVLHEFGHFFFAKLFKVRVEKFFLFFDPRFHLFSTKDRWFTRLFPRCKQNETEYGIGWLPLGGYVKIAGMIDESMDTEQMKQPEQPWEFRSKPAWQRLLVMVGGVLVNFVLALCIYSMVLYAWGDTYIPMRDISMGFQFNAQAKEAGFCDGDLIVAADGKPIDKYSPQDLSYDFLGADCITVLRQGQEVVIDLPGREERLSMLQQAVPFCAPYVPAVVDSVCPGTPAEGAGMKAGDHVLAVNGQSVKTWIDFSVVMNEQLSRLAEPGCTATDSMALRKVTMVYRHDGAEQADTVQLQLTTQYLFGFVKRAYLDSYYTPVHQEYSFWQSIPAGVMYGINRLKGYVNSLRYLFTSDGARQVGGFMTIGSIFPATWHWPTFWDTTAFLSLMLAFMNILPIPALDGGHVLFVLYEMVMRRKPGEKFLERAQWVGMYLLLGLMLLACYNDIMRFIF